MVLIRKLMKEGRLTEEQLIRILFPIGMFGLLISTILGQFAPETWKIDFLIGFLAGLSIILNLSFLVVYGRARRKGMEIRLLATH